MYGRALRVLLRSMCLLIEKAQREGGKRKGCNTRWLDGVPCPFGVLTAVGFGLASSFVSSEGICQHDSAAVLFCAVCVGVSHVSVLLR